jgi:hypothetical protein
MRVTVYSGWLMVVVGVASLIGFAAAGMPVIGGVMLVGLSGSGAFMAWLGRGWDKPLESSDELYKYGRPANATVEKVENEELRPEGVRTAKLTLRVTPVNESAYRTTRVLALPGGRVPAVGQQLTVKFDPQSRKNVVLLEESYEVEDRVQIAARNLATNLP